MSDPGHVRAVERFFHTHPINEAQIERSLAEAGIDAAAPGLDALVAFDQDHYGGTGAVTALADAAAIGQGDRVLDICCGLGGPARVLAARRGCRVVGIDLTASRVAAARRLSARVGLGDRLAFAVGDAQAMPLPDGTFDAAISQEAFLHVPDKPHLMAECVRVLRPGGRLAFTDPVALRALRPEDLARLQSGMAIAGFESADGYRALLEGQGCRVEIVDLSAEWTELLQARLAMYRSLKDKTVARFGDAHFRRWDAIYAFYVGLFAAGTLGGARIVARKP